MKLLFAGKLRPRPIPPLPLLLPHFLLSSMAARSPPLPADSEENPDDSLCSTLENCSLSNRPPTPAAVAECPGRPLGGESRVERAWAHWRRLGSPKLVVAPMVDNSELPFRMLCRSYGAEAAYTPMLHSRIFTENEKYRRMEFTTCKGI